jgi:hypothetical protein
MSMEARMSICNMAIEAGARAGMVIIPRPSAIPSFDLLYLDLLYLAVRLHRMKLHSSICAAGR